MSIFTLGTTPPTPEQAVARSLDENLKGWGGNMTRAYNALYALVYNNPNFVDEYNAFDPSLVETAFDANTNSGLHSGDLRQIIELLKTTIELYAPGTISDSIITATVDFH